MQRILKIQKELSKLKISAALIAKPENVRYLCGYIGTNGRLFITPKKAVLITDFRYLRSARKQIPREVAIFDQKEGIETLLKPYKTLGFEEQFVTQGQYEAMRKRLPGVALRPVSGLVEKVRLIKTPDEAKVMKKAVEIANAAYEKLLTTIKIGISEDELEWNLLTFARELGADGFSFPPIICFGKNTADVHHVKEPNRLKKGEAVLIDMGIAYKGYMTDMTRTVYTREPALKEREIYTIVALANQTAIEAIEVGKTTGEIDRVARDIIKSAGYGDFFGHSTGHGVGLEVHEAPTVSEKATAAIEPGMVFTVEPGIYLNDLGGVRIEDMVYVTPRGKIEVWTAPSKELRVLPL